MRRQFDIVVAVDLNSGIGKEGTLPWKLKGDMAYFKELTGKTKDTGKRNAVIMGRKTWQSIPAKFRPLKDRLNIVISKNSALEVDQGVLTARGLDEALELAHSNHTENIFVIGGSAIYAIALCHPGLNRIYLTQVNARFECDAFLPDLTADFAPLGGWETVVTSENDIEYSFKAYVRNGGLAKGGMATPEAVT